ncbi:MAG: tetratricopeptide repeat protein, partial [Terriglobia bacterium]
MKVPRRSLNRPSGSVGRVRIQSWILVWTVTALLQAFIVRPDAAAQGGTGAAASLRVRITDSTAEVPIERARVELMKFPDGVMQQLFSDASGLVEFFGLGAQSYVVRATRPGYLDAELRLDVRRGEVSKSANLQMQRMPVEGNAPSAGNVTVGSLSIPDSALREFQQGAKLLNSEKNPRDSVVHLSRAIEISPDYSEAHFLLGMAYLQLNSASEAEKALRKAISLQPKLATPYYPLAMLLFGQKRYVEEEELLVEGAKLDSRDWKWPFEIARCKAQRGQWEDALRYAKEAVRLAGAPSKVHLLLADIYSNSGRPWEAVSELELFVHLDPQSPYVRRVQEVLPTLRQRAASEAPS